MAATTFAGSSRFEIVRAIGSGGMGRVYEAIDRRDGGRVALKRLHAVTPQGLLDIRREFRALESVRHENLVALFELIEEDGEAFFTMEMVEGMPLLTYVGASLEGPGASGATTTHVRPAQPRRGDDDDPAQSTSRPRTAETTVDPERLRAVVTQLALGLAVLHAAGKVHRDVKPSNVQVTPAGRVVLLDFGLAVEAREQKRRTVAGTRPFMAPEQAAGNVVGPPADMYALGVVLFVALTSDLPFRGADVERRRAHEPPPPVRSLRPDAPDDLATLCDELRAIDPGARPSAVEVLRRLGVTAAAVSTSSADTPARFVGRRSERELLQRVIAEARARVRVVAIVGDSGVGKSSLVSEVLAEARRREPATLVLSSRCRERELLAYNAFDGIVEGLSGCLLEDDAVTRERLVPPDAEMLSRMFPLLRRVPRFSPAEDDAIAATPLQQRARGLQALRWLLSAIVRERPVVVSIDDLQWADADSLALLAELFGTADAPALALLVTTRPAAPGEMGALAQLDARIGACSRVELGRLPDDEARVLVEDALGSSDDAPTAAAIVREAAGHPLFLLALADQARTGGAIGTESKLDAALWSRVEQVDVRARAVLELLAVAGEPLPASTGTVAAGLDAAAYKAASDTLRIARLARTTSGGAGVEPYHDRVREMLLARLDDARLRSCHARLAEAFQASGRGESHPESLVRHLAAAGEPHRAARHAERAARRALEALAFDQAAHLYRVALELAPTDEAWRHPVRVALADTLASAGRGAEAADVYLECAKSGSADARIDLQRKAADHLIRSGHVARGLDVLAGVLADHGEALPRSTAAALVSMLGPRLLPRVRKLRYVRRDVRELPATELRRFDVYHAVSVSLCLVDTAKGGAFQTRSTALALRMGDLLRIGRALTLEACYVGSTGTAGLARGRRIFAELRKIVEDTRDPYLAACATMVDGFLDHHGGRFHEGEAKFVEAERAFRSVPGSYFEGGFCLWFRLVLLRNLGRYGTLAAGFEEWTRDALQRGDLFNETSIRWNLNAVWLARDDLDAAQRDLEKAAWAPPSVGYHLQHWYLEWARAEIALYAGRGGAFLPDLRRTFARVSRSFIPRIRIQRAMLHWAMGRMLVAAARDASDPEPLLREAARAAAKLAHEEVDYARVWSLLVLAAVEDRRQRPERAADLLFEAQLVAERNALLHHAHAARWRLGGIVRGDEGRVLRERARAWSEKESVARFDKMVEVWAPGFRA